MDFMWCDTQISVQVKQNCDSTTSVVFRKQKNLSSSVEAQEL